MRYMLQAAIKFLRQNINLNKGENVVVVTDRKVCPIFRAICEGVGLLGGKLVKVRIARNRTHSAPLPQLKNTFNQSNVIIGITDKSITHCPETRIARKKFGVRAVTMVEVDKNLFLKAINANQKKIRTISNALSKKLKKCKKVTVTTPAGTILRVNVIKSAVGIDDGNSTKKGRLSNFPYGEVCMAPINIADGIAAIDFSRVGIMPKDEAKISIEKGKIVWGNNKKAENFISYLRKADGEKALKIVELGLGTNPEHRTLIKNIIHDEKIIGSAHIAFGGFGNKRRCKIHEDVILLKPTISFDDKKVIKNGRLLH